MNARAKKVLEEALELSEEERSELVDELIVSLPKFADPEIEKAWDEEIERRVREVNEGRVQLIDGEEAFAGLKKKYASKV